MILTAEESETLLVASLLFGTDNQSLIEEVSEVLPPEAFFFDEYRLAYEVALDLQAAGEVMDVVTLSQAMARRDPRQDWLTWLASMMDCLPPLVTQQVVRSHADTVSKLAKARAVRGLLEKAEKYLDANPPSDGGQRMAESLASKLVEIYADDGVGAQVDKVSVLKELITASEGGVHQAVDLPWQKLNEQVGPLIPGEVVGVTAFSGGGKSTFAGNLFAGLCKMGTPCIYFSTEMGKRMLARVAAAESVTSQKMAEKGLWEHNAGLKRRYQEALTRMMGWPFELVPNPSISPAEVIRRTKILRRRWLNQPVVVVVDHVHRLDYGKEDPNKMVGHATRAFKNAAEELGVIFVLLYQPRKPDELVTMWRPVAAHQIRGDSTVWNELDVHLSPFRAPVKTGDGMTPWGTPATMTTGGVPWLAPLPKRGEELPPGVKVSDEHVFISPDKRRVGGPGDPLFLHIHAPSGKIAETSDGLAPPQYQQGEL